MDKELAELEYTETIVDFTMLCQKYGVRSVLVTLKQCDAAMYEEIKAHINREVQQIPVLLIKRL